MNGAPVSVQNVSRSYFQGGQTVHALQDVSFELDGGETIAITGPSGSGKSTLLHLIGAMDTPTNGSITVGNADVTQLRGADRDAYRRHLGFVFQQFHLLPALSVTANIAAPVIPLHTAFDKYARAQELANAVGLGHRLSALPGQLSGGERQRVAIARALINHPSVLLADEPTGNLDTHNSHQVIELLTTLKDTYPVTLLIATHDPDVARACDRQIVLDDGRLSPVLD
jgi:putative ABC transport system ATP-binding protein